MRKLLMGVAALALLAAAPQRALAQDAMATPGKAVSMVLLPKFLGILPFDQAHKGAEEAAKELKNPTPLQFLGPTPQNSVAGQIEIVTNATTQGVKAIMISNNSGDQIVPAAKAAQAKGIKVVTWDSPIPSSEGEDVFVAQVDFNDIGKVMADMTLDITGPAGGEFAILSASPDAANQNAWIAGMKKALQDPKYAKLKLVDTVYGNDELEKSYTQAQALVDKYPNLKVIMAPTSVGIVAAAKALQDEKLCDKIKISGLGLPSEMLAYTKNGCAPEFALWSFVDLGYLTYYTSYLLATDAMKAEEGAKFKAGRMGEFTITKDPTRAKGLRVLMGPFTVYNKDNVEAAAKYRLHGHKRGRSAEHGWSGRQVVGLQVKAWSATVHGRARNLSVMRRHEAGAIHQLRQGLPADLAICGACDLAHEHNLARTFVRGQIPSAVGEDGGLVERTIRTGHDKGRDHGDVRRRPCARRRRHRRRRDGPPGLARLRAATPGSRRRS